MFSAVLEFESPAGLVEYLRNPQHERLGKAFWEHCESTAIVETEFVSADDPDVVNVLTKNLAAD